MKELNKNQKWLYNKIMKLGKNKKVVDMSYTELFSVLDRVKFCYFLDLARIEGLIEITTKGKRKYDKKI